LNRNSTCSRKLVFAVLLFLTVPTLLDGVTLSPVHIPISDTLSYLVGWGVSVDGSPSVSRLIISEIRLPRVLLGLLVGCALAISGGTMQGLFRNPLASPYVLGIASGASTGASLVILLNLRGALFLPLGAFIGGILAAGIVYRLAQERSKKTSVYTLILAGVAVGALFSAVTSFTIFLCSGSEKITDVIFWTMGGLGRANWTYLHVLTPVVAFGSVVLITFSRGLNALSMGRRGRFAWGGQPGDKQAYHVGSGHSHYLICGGLRWHNRICRVDYPSHHAVDHRAGLPVPSTNNGDRRGDLPRLGRFGSAHSRQPR